MPTPKQLEGLCELRAQINALKRLPNDFRDIVPGTVPWTEYATLMPNSVAAMQTWLYGPVIYIEIAEKEKLILGRHRLYYQSALKEPPTKLEDFWELFEEAELKDASHVYIRGLRGGVVRGVNQLLSQCNASFRFSLQLCDDQGHSFPMESKK